MIQTVNGKIEKDTLGKTLAHEHISCASNDFVRAFGKKWLDKALLADYASDVLALAKKEYGICTFVDGTPIELGRDVSLLKEVSDKSGVNIVASTGFYWFPDLEFMNNDEKLLSELLIMEIEEGIEETGIKPGILKCAAGYLGMTNDIITRHSAVGIAQEKTGLPAYVHCEHRGDIAFEQIDALVKNGATPEKIIIGHSALRPEWDYYARLLKSGCYVCVDQCHCVPDKLDSVSECVANACESGYGDKILLSNDFCIHSDFSPKDKNGLHLEKSEQVRNMGYAFDSLYDRFISHGGKEEDWQKITAKNHAEVLDI